MGTTTRRFGIITNTSGITGGILVNGFDTTDAVDVAQARDQQGRVCDIAAYSKNQTATVSGVLDTAKGDLATAGSILTIDGKEWLIQSVQKTQSNQQFVQVSLSIRTADNAIITPVYSSSSTSSSTFEG